jgi:dolichol-phosphate mannosyltransferase
MVNDVLAPLHVSYAPAPSPVKTPLLSVAIPVYNERATLLTILEKIRDVPLSMELLLVEDGSTDGTRELLKTEIEGQYDNVRVLYHEKNQGKGAAIVTAIGAARGEFLIVQDADLEYDPHDYPRLLAPLISGEAQVVYGSRFKGRVTNMRLPNLVANKLLTLTTNILFPGARISDEATCYKVFRTDLLQKFTLNSRRFDFCPEVTAKVLKRGIKIHEVPIEYVARSVSQGKKIRWTDAFDAFWTLVKYRFTE